MSPPSPLPECPACGGREAAEIASREAIRREMEALWAFHLRRLRPGAPATALTDRLAFTQPPPLRLLSCTCCGTLRRDPEEGETNLLDRYAAEALSPAVLGALFEAQRTSARRQMDRLARLGGPRGEGLEVGLYTGAFLAAAEGSGWRFHGIDVNEGAVAFARSLGLSADRGTLEDLPVERRYDALAIWNCFEQLPAPRTALHRAHALLRPGGVLALRVPNGAFYRRCRARLDGAAHHLAVALLAHNNLLAFPYRYGFTPASLTYALEAAGFRVAAIHAEALVPTADRWTRRWAVWEERTAKALLRRLPARSAPWLELYARAAA
jgi:SAM-dependent methyltransferase